MEQTNSRTRLAWPSEGLWREADFLRLWSAQGISALGSRITRTALPILAVMTIGASVEQESRHPQIRRESRESSKALKAREDGRLKAFWLRAAPLIRPSRPPSPRGEKGLTALRSEACDSSRAIQSVSTACSRRGWNPGLVSQRQSILLPHAEKGLTTLRSEACVSSRTIRSVSTACSRRGWNPGLVSQRQSILLPMGRRWPGRPDEGDSALATACSRRPQKVILERNKSQESPHA